MKNILFLLLLNVGFLSCQEPSTTIRIDHIQPSDYLYEKAMVDTTIILDTKTYETELANTPQWEWVSKVIKTGSITPTAYANLIVDPDGNSYITNYVPTQNNDIDVYLTKINDHGELIWEILTGGTRWDSGHDLAFDMEGNIWVVGYFTETAKFGEFTLEGDNEYNLFLAQFNPDGECKQAFKLASDNTGFSYANGTIGDGQLGGFSINISQMNEIFISGEFERTLSFDTIHLTSERQRSSFIAKFDLTGKCAWAIKAESNNWCYSFIRHFSVEGNLFFQSTCSDTLYVGGVSKVGNSEKTGEILIAKINTSGSCEWIKSINYSDQLSGVTISQKPISFYLYANPDNIKIFNSKYKVNGKNIWLAEVNHEGEWQRILKLGNKANEGDGVIWDYTQDSDGNIFVAGTFSGMTYFGDFEVINRENTRGSGFVAKYKNDGTCEWVKLIHCEGKIIWLRSVRLVGDALYLTGNYQLRADFDNLRIQTNEKNSNVNEIFLAKLKVN